MFFIHRKLIYMGLALTIMSACFLVSCSPKIDASETVKLRDLVYRKGDDKPFTGVVTGKSRHEGYRTQTCLFEKKYKDGKLNGRTLYTYLNGKTESIEPYENGELNGVVTRYYESGQIKARLHFVDGMRGGVKGEMFWDEKGERTK